MKAPQKLFSIFLRKQRKENNKQSVYDNFYLFYQVIETSFWANQCTYFLWALCIC